MGALSELVAACLVRGPRTVRNALTAQLAPLYEELIAGPRSFCISSGVLSVGTVPQRVACAQAVIDLARDARVPAHMGGLVLHALDSLGAKERVRMQSTALFLIERPWFSLLKEYFLSLDAVLTAHAD